MLTNCKDSIILAFFLYLLVGILGKNNLSLLSLHLAPKRFVFLFVLSITMGSWHLCAVIHIVIILSVAQIVLNFTVGIPLAGSCTFLTLPHPSLSTASLSGSDCSSFTLYLFLPHLISLKSPGFCYRRLRYLETKIWAIAVLIIPGVLPLL